MKRPTFLEGVGVAVAASLSGSILYTALSAVSGGALRLVVAALALGYMVYLLARSREHVGRITAAGLWVMFSILLWALDLPLAPYVLAHVGALWLLRSLYFHAGVLAAIADLALNAFALAAAVWALAQSGSLLLGLWSFFLVQALFVAIPPGFPRKRAPGAMPTDGDDRFRQAHRVAESAVRRLSSLH